MEILSPAHYLSNPSWFLDEGKNTKWTPAENKAFENALALFDKDTPDRWQRVAEMVPGKTVVDVIRQYKELEDDVSRIEAGLITIPGYSTSPFTLEWGNSHSFDGHKQSYVVGGKRLLSNRSLEQERKKGIPWTEEEHKLFLMGLKKYGKGDWRNISRNFVVTRTPTQVASHAQKYFIRQLSGGKDKRRASIHDITTIDLNDNQTPSPDYQKPTSPDQSTVISQQPKSAANAVHKIQWNQANNGNIMGFNSAQGSLFMSPLYGGNSYGKTKMQSQPYFGSQSMNFQLQSAYQYHHA
ncbi:hypothetical protein RND71_024971 [Anisodus tanguticus]|uniref:Uncharacterized protein n=1 Tax=Anisodus tanguticus TaxID=243964 RepID=A0AAE1RPB1_9SOLA|nr:hypothetical protein RND71_024971 [Anisodus tanguticus]